jgi:hypothetical protein
VQDAVLDSLGFRITNTGLSDQQIKAVRTSVRTKMVTQVQSPFTRAYLACHTSSHAALACCMHGRLACIQHAEQCALQLLHADERDGAAADQEQVHTFRERQEGVWQGEAAGCNLEACFQAAHRGTTRSTQACTPCEQQACTVGYVWCVPSHSGCHTCL